jgi:hypothetical protein
MRLELLVGLLLTVPFMAACASKQPATPAASAPFVESGFLTADYARLVPVAPGAARRTYENPDAPFSKYPKIFVDRITIWRDVDQTEPVESDDFQKVVDDLYAVLTRELGHTFALVDERGPGVARMRIALVAIDHPDDQLDVYVTKGTPTEAAVDEALPPGLREFGRQAWLEAEMLDASTDEVVFAVVDRAADVMPRPKPIGTWRDLHDAFVAWAKQAAKRLADLKNATS